VCWETQCWQELVPQLVHRCQCQSRYELLIATLVLQQQAPCLFDITTNSNNNTGNYSFTTIEPNIGVASIPVCYHPSIHPSIKSLA
jgi:hypothetical protein